MIIVMIIDIINNFCIINYMQHLNTQNFLNNIIYFKINNFLIFLNNIIFKPKFVLK